jgi:hypothetical protein
MLSRMVEKKVPHHALISQTSSGCQAGQGLGPPGKHLGAYLASPWIMAVEKDIPMAQHSRLAIIDAPQGLLEFHEATQRRRETTLKARWKVV